MYTNDLSSAGDRTTVSNPQPTSEYWCVTYSDYTRRDAAYARMAAAGTAAAAVCSVDHCIYLRLRNPLNEAAIDDLFPYAHKRWCIDQATFDGMAQAHRKLWQAPADPTPLESTADPTHWRITLQDGAYPHAMADLKSAAAIVVRFRENVYGRFDVLVTAEQLTAAINSGVRSVTAIPSQDFQAVYTMAAGGSGQVWRRDPTPTLSTEQDDPIANEVEAFYQSEWREFNQQWDGKRKRQDAAAGESQPRPAAGGAPVETQQKKTSQERVPDLDDDQDDPASYFGSDAVDTDGCPPTWHDDRPPSDDDVPPAEDLAENDPTPSTKGFYTMPHMVMESLRRRSEQEQKRPPKKQATPSIVSRQNNSLDPTPQQRPPKNQAAAPASSQDAMEKKRQEHINAKSRARTRRDNGGMDLYPAGSINQRGVKAFQYPSIDDLANIIRKGKGGCVPDFSKVAARAIQAYIPVLNAKDKEAKKAAKDAYDKVKAGLPYVVCSSVAWEGQRKAEGGYFHTGYTVHDLDGLTADQVEAAYTDLMAIPEVWLVSRSASRHGLWCLVAHDQRPVDSTDKPKGNPTHKDAWQAADDLVYEATGVKPDKATKDIRRVRYIAHDPNVFIRDEVERVRFVMPFNFDELPAVDPAAAAANQAAFATMDDGAAAAGGIAEESTADPTPSSESQPKRYDGKSKAEWNLYKIQDAMSKHSPVGWSYEHWLAVGFGLRRAEARGELPAGTGQRLWDDWSATDPDRYKAGDCERKWAGFGIDGKGIGTVFYLFQQAGWTTPDKRKVSKNGKKGGGVNAELVTSSSVKPGHDYKGRKIITNDEDGLIQLFDKLEIYPVEDEGDPASMYQTETNKAVTWADIVDDKIKAQSDKLLDVVYHKQTGLFAFRDKHGDTKPARFSMQAITSANNSLGHDRRINRPVLYLESLPSVDPSSDPPAMLAEIFNVGDDPMAQAMAEYLDKILGLGFAVKAFKPQILIDRTPLLIGGTGVGKSSFCEHLMPLEKGWHTKDVSPYSSPKEIIEDTSGHYLVEMDEVAKHQQGSVLKLQSFFAQTKDTARGAYGRNARSVYRRFLIVLTSNDLSAGLFPFDESKAMARRLGILRIAPKKDPEQVRSEFLPKNRDSYFGYWYAVYKFLLSTGGLPAIREALKMPTSLLEWNINQFDGVQESDDIAQAVAEAIYATLTSDAPPAPATLAEWLYGLGYVKDPTAGKLDKEGKPSKVLPSTDKRLPVTIPDHVKPELTSGNYKRFAREVGQRFKTLGGKRRQERGMYGKRHWVLFV